LKNIKGIDVILKIYQIFLCIDIFIIFHLIYFYFIDDLYYKCNFLNEINLFVLQLMIIAI